MLLALVVPGVFASRLRSNFVECKVPKAVKYSASWFASSSLIRSLSSNFLNETRLQKSGTMMEGASFILFDKGTVYKSLDFLDFYVEHLSWYERLLAKPAKEAGLQEFTKETLKRRVGQQPASPPQRSGDKKMVVAVMPFYGAGSGQGPSAVEMRCGYLNATIASVRSSLTDLIVVAVENRGDLQTVRRFDLFDEFYFHSLKSPDKLGVASLIAIHRALTGESNALFSNRRDWRDVEYVYYTESDQILRLAGEGKTSRRRILLDQIDEYGADRAIVVPRRAVPVPLLTDFQEGRERDALFDTESLKPYRELTTKQKKPSCTCFFEGPVCKRIDLRPINSSTDVLVTASSAGFGILPAEGNFRKLLFRKCYLDC